VQLLHFFLTNCDYGGFWLGTKENLSKHRKLFFQNTENNPFKTPKENLSKRRKKTFQNTENALTNPI